MKEEKMILGENRYYSMDCHQTQLNNNVLVVGLPAQARPEAL